MCRRRTPDWARLHWQDYLGAEGVVARAALERGGRGLPRDGAAELPLAEIENSTRDAVLSFVDPQEEMVSRMAEIILKVAQIETSTRCAIARARRDQPRRRDADGSGFREERHHAAAWSAVGGLRALSESGGAGDRGAAVGAGGLCAGREDDGSGAEFGVVRDPRPLAERIRAVVAKRVGVGLMMFFCR